MLVGRNAPAVLLDGLVPSLVVGVATWLVFRRLSDVPQPDVGGLSLLVRVTAGFFVLVSHGVYAAVEQLWVRAAPARDGVLPFAITKPGQDGGTSAVSRAVVSGAAVSLTCQLLAP
jgi:hypothetical protein